MTHWQPMTPEDHVRSTLNWWLTIVRAAAVSVEVFLHKRFGERYCRLQALLILPLASIYAWFCQAAGYDIRPLLRFFIAYLAALAVAQLGVLWRLYRGDREHSLYNGYPRWLPNRAAAREKFAKLWFEPLLVGVFGMLVADQNRPLGIYLIFAGCSLFVSNARMHLWQRRQVIDLHDAVFEQRHTAASFRGLQDD